MPQHTASLSDKLPSTALQTVFIGLTNQHSEVSSSQRDQAIWSYGEHKARSLQYIWFLKKVHSEVKLSSLFLCWDMMPDCTYLRWESDDRRRNVYWCLQVCKQQFVWSTFWSSYCRAGQNSECKKWLTYNPWVIWMIRFELFELAVHHRKFPWTAVWFGI